MKRIHPQHPTLLLDGRPTSDSDFRTLHDELAAFDDVQWIDDRAPIVE